MHIQAFLISLLSFTFLVSIACSSKNVPKISVHSATDYAKPAKEALLSPTKVIEVLQHAAQNNDIPKYKSHLTEEFQEIVESLSADTETRQYMNWPAFLDSLGQEKVENISENVFYERASVRLLTKSGKVLHFKLSLVKTATAREWKVMCPEHILELYENTQSFQRTQNKTSLGE